MAVAVVRQAFIIRNSSLRFFFRNAASIAFSCDLHTCTGNQLQKLKPSSWPLFSSVDQTLLKRRRFSVDEAFPPICRASQAADCFHGQIYDESDGDSSGVNELRIWADSVKKKRRKKMNKHKYKKLRKRNRRKKRK